MTDISVNELLALIGEQAVRIHFLEAQLEKALARIDELVSGPPMNNPDLATKQLHTE